MCEMRKNMSALYETKISTARWWAYDIPGNAGWITYLICLGKCLGQKRDLFSVAACLPGAAMLLGIVELICERAAGLDRVLPKKRLLRGFGALTLSGIGGMLVSLFGVITHRNGSRPRWMAAGSALCAVFAGLIYKSFHKTGR